MVSLLRIARDREVARCREEIEYAERDAEHHYDRSQGYLADVKEEVASYTLSMRHRIRLLDSLVGVAEMCDPAVRRALKADERLVELLGEERSHNQIATIDRILGFAAETHATVARATEHIGRMARQREAAHRSKRSM